VSNDNLPDSIPFTAVREALTTLGINVDDGLISVEFGPDHITATRTRMSNDGKFLSAGKDLAEVVSTIGYDR
jgi:hypothetical protein